MTIADDLWTFSLAVYARAGVAPACLQLQDQWAGNVNLLLWLHWLESRGQVADNTLIARAEAELNDWDKRLLQPLRQLRRQLRDDFSFDQASVEATYQQLKVAELQAERVAQEQLAALVTVTASAKKLSVGTNLRVYLDRLGVAHTEQQALLTCFGE